jgi:penicillin-binding protein 1A
MEQGFLPERAYPDGEVEIMSVDGSIWRPTDMSGYSNRMMTMREGLVYSKNTITAQVMQDVGLSPVVDLARAAGINQSRLVPVPSLSLGTSPVTLLEMVSAYSTIARAGEYRQPMVMTRIADRNGKLLAQFETRPQRALSKYTALQLIDMMRGVIRHGTGVEFQNRFNIVADIAGKTGTTQHNTDGWFILMHPDLVAGAWVGFNDSRVTMRSDYWGQGGHNAVLLVGDFFRDVVKARRIDAKAKFAMPAGSPPMMVHANPDVQMAEESEGVPSGHGVITRPGSDTALVVGPGVRQTVRARDADADELGRFLGGLGIGPVAGAGSVQSSGASGGSSGSSAAGAAVPFSGIAQ